LALSDASRMFQWMTDPGVRLKVGVTREPSMDATVEWLEHALSDRSFHPRAILNSGEHVGNVVLDQIDHTAGTARLSIYIGPSSERHRGLGRRAIGLVLREAFDSLHLRKVWLTVAADNEPAVRCYVASGFSVDERLPGAFGNGTDVRDALKMSIVCTTRCVIVQPSYIPWRGYFDLIRRADVFVFLDDVQYDKHGWRNRNRVKTPRGSEWLTIPAHAKGTLIERTPIRDIQIEGSAWSRKHLRTLVQLYRGAPHFAEYHPWLEAMYASPPKLLADFTIASTVAIAGHLGIRNTRFLRSSDIQAEGAKTDRLIAILQKLGATHYLSGPTAKAYIEPDKFENAGIVLEWMDYVYPEYPQLYPPFDPFVTVLDLLFMTGSDSPRYIWGSD
jgi:RimJ/RimL family protein N-acetyltransferase